MALDRDFVRNIAVRMKEGKTQREIGEELGVHQVTVARTVLQRNLDETLGMLALADKGYTLAEIGEEYGVTKQRVSQIIGVEQRRGSSGRKVQMDAAIETWEAMMEVARKFDIPVRNREGEVDTRAIVQLMDRIAEKELVVMPVR